MMGRSPKPLAFLLAVLVSLVVANSVPAADRPNIVLLTVDTLRADRISALGYDRPTTPHIDALLEGGVNFTQARTIEPLTGPALASMLTSLPPHVHGGTRNGLRIREGLSSLPLVLEQYGYTTAAFVGNWTLRHKFCGLGEHFEHYETVLNRARWFGFLRREATARDLTQTALEWIEDHTATTRRPFLAWIHYVEPHAPYKLQEDHLEVLGERQGGFSKADRYDTEVAFVDSAIGVLLEALAELSPPNRTLIVFASDHGESLGEHGYWGHGRNLHDPGLRIPLGLYWAGRLEPTTIAAPALNTDVPPTVLGLLGIPAPAEFVGYDWTGVLRGAARAPSERMTCHEAHRGAVIAKHQSELARRYGLLEVATLHRGRKEILRVRDGNLSVYDLSRDPREESPLADGDVEAAAPVHAWLRAVQEGLSARDRELPPELLDDEAIAELRSLGYLD